MRFKEWLDICENTTSQAVNQAISDNAVRRIYEDIAIAIAAQPWIGAISKPIKTLLIKWCFLQFIRMPDYARRSARTTVLNDILRSRDYLAAMLRDAPQVIKSKLNDFGYTVAALDRDSEAWHIKLAAAKRSMPAEGRIIPLAGMPAGWTWVSLDKPYCDEEADAMGHCGNAGYNGNDNIYSLRDATGKAHLTFIVNDGFLGESKGYGNNKPSRIYHQQIIALLLGQDRGSNIVDHVAGGGYKPENNFEFMDLPKVDRERILKIKPHMLDYMQALSHRYDNNADAVESHLKNMFDFNFEKVDLMSGTVVMKTFGDVFEAIKWLNEETSSNLKEMPDLDEISAFDMDVSLKDSVYIYESYADSVNELIISKIIGGKDLEEYAEEDDSLGRALRWSAADGYRAGAQNEAYKQVVSQLNASDDNGFNLSPASDNRWQLTISSKNLIKLQHSYGADKEHLTKAIEFSYASPYNGYEGFDEETYNESLGNNLHELVVS